MNKITNDEFADYVAPCQNGMYSFAYALLKHEADAQDAVSEAIVKAFENKHKLREREKFKSWIMEILMNVIRAMIRKQNRLLVVPDVEALETNVVDEKKYDNLWDAVMSLEAKFRMVVILYYFESFSTIEISEIIKVPEGTVRSRLARARNKLKSLIEL